MNAESKDSPKLTQFSHGAGCGCKLPAADLNAVMSVLPRVTDPRLVVSTDTGDDAAVYDLGNGEMLIQTLDFFTPVVDDPYTFGAIAAANAISDVYAMGGRPIFGLNIVAFPSKTLDLGVLREILRGGSDKAREAGFFIAGGHSIDDAEPKFGMVVNGLARREDILTNAGAQEGDVVIITKPLGVGIMTTAVKKGLATESDIQPAIDSMASLNKPGADACNKVGAHAATDITGFGLLGHVGNIARESSLTIEIEYSKLPFFEQAVDLVQRDVAPGGSRKNLSYYGPHVDFDPSLEAWQRLLCADAQTSGGMAICVPEDRSAALIEALEAGGALCAAIVGRCITRTGKRLIIRA